jgi:hypothetical protein
MNVLAYAAASFGIAEVPIQTIYLNQNRCSHFQPFWDSMRIYLVLARFYLSSLVAAAIDLLIFAFVFWMTASVLVSVVSGRVSSIVNFVLNRRLVFRGGSAGARPAEPPRDCGQGLMAAGAYRRLVLCPTNNWTFKWGCFIINHAPPNTHAGRV